MIKPLLLCFVYSFFYVFSFSQNPPDSSKNLSEVTVKAFEQNKQLRQTSAAINYVGQAQLERFNNTNILPAVNSTPGVRMEERSPGSYRMNIRGSTLRSPFGVRNVKIYFDEIPFTDAGGNTYLNQLNYYNFNSIEVIKGPSGSLYGAGTGGVMLIHSLPATWQPGFDAAVLGGSYGLFNTNLQVRAGKEGWQNALTYSYQTSDGYRHHTSMNRQVLNWQMKILKIRNDEIKLSVLYGDLYYQTPGALTKAEYLANPRAARPKAGAFQSADSIKAAIFQKTIFGGVTNIYRLSDHFDNTTTFFGSFSEVKNPTFRNYEKRKEPQWGARTVFKWNKPLHTSLLQVVFGGELQDGYFHTKTYTNKYGKPDVMQTDDYIWPDIYSLFAQGDVQLPADWDITAGASINKTTIKINRVSATNFTPVIRNFNNELAPRVAVSKRILKNLWAYGSISKGFSPPSVAEVLPSTTVISTDMQAEHGVNYETGIKSSWLKQRLYVEINGFYYRLENAIVQRKDASNADYFANAGSTRQRGIESQASYKFFVQQHSLVSSMGLWISHTWDKFNYDEFKQSTTDYSGKQLPSVAPHTVAAGFDFTTRHGIYSNLTYFYSDRIPLNDANSEYASSYNLLSERLGWKKSLKKKILLDLFVGSENLFNVTYSLGNDINAAGGRYYNAAPGRSFYGGGAIHFN
ncbi:MAG TPA: TonB-dependent receptor plug domain-containing protein [Chitinophagaceae bacterium]|nr:TonB-dependent receptor plug domain-containing protein [Chitinophagaceae bacterium]